MPKKKQSEIRNFKRKAKPKVKKFMNILLGLAAFLVLVGAAFTISPLFGAAFVLGFALCIYNGELKTKAWKPIAIFIGALIIRLGLQQFFNPVLESKTIMDLSVSAIVFLGILVFGWKIKKS